MYNKRFFQGAAVMAVLLFCNSLCTTPPAPISSCADTSENLIPLRITLGDTIRLHLDSLLFMGIETPVQYLEKEQRLLVFDKRGRRLLSYPVSGSPTLNQPVDVHPINIDKTVSYFHYLGPDSLILYTYGGDFNLYYYDLRTDSIYRTLSFMNKNVRPNAAQHPALPAANNANPLVFKRHAILGAGYLIGESDDEIPAGRTLFASIQIPEGRIRYMHPYPAVYHQGNWGGAHMRTPYLAYNQQQDQLVLSLPADHHLEVIDTAWHVKSIYAGTRENICISALQEPKSSENMRDTDHALRYFTRTPAYRDIIFDPYQQRYYRILQLAPPFGVDEPVEKPARLIALDKDFHYLGEAALPMGLALDNFFVTARGIYFFNANNHDEDTGEYIQISVL